MRGPRPDRPGKSARGNVRRAAVSPIAGHHLPGGDFPVAVLAVRVEDLARRLGLELQIWEEEGLGPATGALCRLPSGRLVALCEHAHAVEHLGAPGPDVVVNGADLLASGANALVAEILAAFDLPRSAVAWMMDGEGERFVAEALTHRRARNTADSPHGRTGTCMPERRSDLDLLPPGLAALSASRLEIVLPLQPALQAVDALAEQGRAIMGWEGWLGHPDGRVGHAGRHQGTVAFLPATGQAWREYVRASVEFARDTMREHQEEFDRAPEVPGAVLLFCISVNEAT